MMVRTGQVNTEILKAKRGKKSRESVAHELRKRGHATDAKAIWRWETGRNQPSARVLPDLAEVLGVVSVDDLYGNDAPFRAAA
jgi:transcriptional regulator with XRE-family HTH domain